MSSGIRKFDDKRTIHNIHRAIQEHLAAYDADIITHIFEEHKGGARCQRI